MTRFATGSGAGRVMCAFGGLVAALLPLGGFGGVTGDGAVAAYTSEEAAAQGAPSAGAGSGDRWQRHAICNDWVTFVRVGAVGVARFTTSWSPEVPACTDGEFSPIAECVDGSVPLDPWWVSREESGTYGPWEITGSQECQGDIVARLVEQAWASMPIAPNTYEVQPSGGYAVAELGVNLIVDTNPRTMDVTLLGTPVIIRAVPTLYSWTNTDGTVWASTDPGKRYADGGEPFTFPRKPEHRTTFTLTTTWRGEFSTTNGVTWREAPGTATTTSNSTTVHVYNPHAHRVDCDLDGNCVNGTQGAGNQKTAYDPDGDGILNYLIPDDKIDDYLTTRDQDRTWTDPERKNTN